MSRIGRIYSAALSATYDRYFITKASKKQKLLRRRYTDPIFDQYLWIVWRNNAIAIRNNGLSNTSTN